MSRVDDALDGLTAREARELRDRLDKRLQECVLDGSDGAIPVRVTTRLPSKVAFTLMLCPACIERHRLPESESK